MFIFLKKYIYFNIGCYLITIGSLQAVYETVFCVVFIITLFNLFNYTLSIMCFDMLIILVLTDLLLTFSALHKYKKIDYEATINKPP